MTQFFEEIKFQPFPKIARISRDMIITEKLDGTNAQVIISEDGTQIGAASRTRLITPADDNFGFAKWVQENRDELLKLGPGRHFGEWWGQGVQRTYGLKERRFSLFNVSKWYDAGVAPFAGDNEKMVACPVCCHVVPILYVGPFDTAFVNSTLNLLGATGSKAAPGFDKPEGIVIFHVHGGYMFKKTFEKDEAGKERGA